MVNQKEKVRELIIEIALPEGISAELDNGMLSLRGPKGDVKRKFLDKNIIIQCKDKVLSLKASRFNKANKKLIKSYVAHIKGMIRGVSDGYRYTLKICSGHFPMNVSVSNNKLIVKNFLGEKSPRILELKPGADVKVEGDHVVVESKNKEIAGQVSSDIEQLTRRTRYDMRIFQDGIWIVSKDRKETK